MSVNEVRWQLPESGWGSRHAWPVDTATGVIVRSQCQLLVRPVCVRVELVPATGVGPVA